MTNHTTPDDLVKRAKFALHDMRGKLGMFSQCLDRIEQLEAELRGRRLERDHANDCADAAIDRVKQLEAAIIAALRAPDEDTTREILRNARDGVLPTEGGE